MYSEAALDRLRFIKQAQILQQKLTELEAFKQTLAGVLEDCERALADTERTFPRTDAECPVIETLGSKRS